MSLWDYANQHAVDAPELSQLCPMWGKYCFVPGRADGGFKMWLNKGVEKISDLYLEGN